MCIFGSAKPTPIPYVPPEEPSKIRIGENKEDTEIETNASMKRKAKGYNNPKSTGTQKFQIPRIGAGVTDKDSGLGV